MKPRFLGGTFDDVVRFLKDLNRFSLISRESVTLTPVSVASNSAIEQTFPVARITANDSFIVDYVGAQTAGICIGSARSSSADTLAIIFINPTAGALTPAAGEYRLIKITP